MKVALDATPLAGAGAGLSRYVSELSLALGRVFPDDRFFLLSDQRFQVPYQATSNVTGCAPRRSILNKQWWLCGAVRQSLSSGVEVFHGLNFEVPLLPALPSVLTLLDLSPWSAADWTDDYWRAISSRVRRRTPAIIALGLATMIVTATESVRRQAIERFRITPSRIVAVPLAASAYFRPIDVPPPVKPYFLYVGTLEPRKNIMMLTTAWRELAARHDVDLLLAGRARPGFELPELPGLRALGEVPDEELRRLYSGAVACLYPSLYEGFGLPPLEAMRCGCPVLVSSESSIVEVTGQAALSLDSRDTRAWIEAMTALLQTRELREEWRTRGLARAAEFSWERTARSMRELYVEAQRRF